MTEVEYGLSLDDKVASIPALVSSLRQYFVKRQQTNEITPHSRHSDATHPIEAG